MGRQLVSEYLQDLTGIGNTQLKTYITSDYDDVSGGVDLIVEMTFEDGITQYLGLDIAVTSNLDYLENKVSKEETYCTEFNLSQGLDPYHKIERKVLNFHPEVMSELLYRYLTSIENGGHISALQYFRSINSRFQSGKKGEKYIRKQIAAKINNILNIE